MTVRAAVPDGVIAPGVSVGGVAVGGMTAAQAAPWISQSVLGTITVKLGGPAVDFASASARAGCTPTSTGAAAGRRSRAGRTAAVVPGTDIPVVTRISGNGLRNWIRSLAPQVRTDPTDARFELVKSVPRRRAGSVGSPPRRARRDGASSPQP